MADGKTARLLVETRRLADLTPHPKNPRLHPHAQVDKLRDSLDRFGYTKGSIVVSPDGTIITGHGIYEALEADLFCAFLCGKACTLKDKGGNTDTIYNTGDKRRAFAESLRHQHPDLVKVVWRYNRWHHQVNYRPFKKRRLEYRDDYEESGNLVNDYGMVLYRPIEQENNSNMVMVNG